MRFLCSLAGVLLLTWLAVAAQGTTPDAVARDLQRKYDRVTDFSADFVHAYLDRFGVTCGLDDTCEASGCPRSPDPDCDPCAWNETCEEDCPTRDADCELEVCKLKPPIAGLTGGFAFRVQGRGARASAVR